jgi:3-deoxy-D-manno-octulosonic-acid transferase
MNLIYNIAVYTVGFVLKIVAIFNKKIALFLKGRKQTFHLLNAKIAKDDSVIWFHCASLGEFEQGRPLIEKIKKDFPNYKILLTFFSPSGYEVRKDYAFADVITYLPLDTKRNAKKFVKMAHPEMAIFVKYEFWPNFLQVLKKKNIDTILVSGIFRKNQSFFKFYGAWMRKSLQTFSHFFVQNENSKKLLQNIDFKNVTISGDTRFDRVYEITKHDNHLQFVQDFVQNKYTLVAGSTWPKDEELLVNYINNYASDDEKFIIAPHNVNEKTIQDLQQSILKKSILFSDKVKDNSVQVLIINTIGILTKIYSYADVAYIGGGFGVGIHNVLEPASFGIPLIIGPNYQKFQEAVDLVDLNACKVVDNKEDLNTELTTLFNDENYRMQKGKITKSYIEKNIGASQIIMNYMHKKLIAFS